LTGGAITKLVRKDYWLIWRLGAKCGHAYSKKLENHMHAVALFVAHFNFCRKHSAHGMTPAMAAGITDHVWTIQELLDARY
jgi:hypothetical protein